jgi:ribosomal protein S18 acetylase RimI-like enzyme
LIHYRPFRNGDPPAIAAVWRTQPPLRARVQHLSTTAFERLVLGKPYFDRKGLIVAVEDDQLIGFVHAGFGPSEDGSCLRTDLGVTCLAMVTPHERQAEVAAELVRQSEEYLRRSGAGVLYAGGFEPVSPFYVGLYGGSRLPGVLASDQAALDLYGSAGYREEKRHIILQRKLTGFRPVMDRRQMQLRRQCRIVKTLDPRPSSWWEGCLTTHMDCIRYGLKPSRDDPPCGKAVFWDMEPLATGWGVHARGLVELEIEEPSRRQGMATFLLGEAMREMRAHGVAFVETQARQTDTAALRLFDKLGFEEVEQGIVLRKAE